MCRAKLEAELRERQASLRILRHLTEAVKARAKFGRAKIRVLKQNGSVESVIGI